jgi:protein-S-isoprenylcysteine O-methyltransferase Ste14
MTLLKWSGVLFWLILGSLQLSVAFKVHDLVPLFLAAQSTFAAYWLIRRRKATAAVRWWMQIIAWGAVLLPMALRIESPSPVGSTASLVGLSMTLWSLSALGTSFGLAPADRGLVTGGPYRYLRHPMYTGELISVLGALATNWSAWNAVVVALLLILLIWRIYQEEKLIFGYSNYCNRTPWRVLPGVW